jgi:hypothetical protein
MEVHSFLACQIPALNTRRSLLQCWAGRASTARAERGRQASRAQRWSLAPDPTDGGRSRPDQVDWNWKRPPDQNLVAGSENESSLTAG